MKVALLSLLFRRYHLDKIFEVAAEAGYDGVEIWGGRPRRIPTTWTRRAASRCWS